MEEFTMNTAVVSGRRSLLPMLNLVLASSAVILAVIAIAADDVEPVTAVPAAPVATIFGPAHPLGEPDIGIPCSARVYTRC
jgi:hypothetical protein